MKRKLALFLAFLLAISTMIGSLSGCSDGGETQSGDGEYVDLNILFVGFTIEDDYKYHQQVQDAINEKLYKDLGFKVRIHPTSYIDQYETMIALDMAQKMSYDFIRTSNGTAAPYAEKDTFLDIKPMIDKYAPELWDLIPDSAWAENTINGKVYGVPTCSFPISYGFWFRGDWLKKLGKEKPTSLAELESLCQAILDDKTINPNGKVVPLAGHRDILEQILLGMFTEHPGDYLENGKVMPKFFDPGYRQFVEKLAEWYKKGYIDDMVLNGDENTINNLISQGIVGIHAGNCYQLEYSVLNSYNTQLNLDMQWSIPFAKDTKTYYSSGFGTDIIAFPATGKNSEKAFQYFNWYFNNEENSDLVLYGIEDLTYTRKQDPATGKDILAVPESEVTGTIKTMNDLMGFFGVNTYTTLQLKNTYATRPAEASRAYDSCNTQEVLNNTYMDVTKYFQVTLPTDIGTKANDIKTYMVAAISDIIVGKTASTDAVWASMRAEWEKLGGQKVYDHYTSLYEQNKSTLSFLQ